jgi:hypothetical protein
MRERVHRPQPGPQQRRRGGLGRQEGDAAGHRGRRDAVVTVLDGGPRPRPEPRQIERLDLVGRGLGRLGRSHGDHLIAAQAVAHARASQTHTSRGRPGWAAAVLLQARGEATRHRWTNAVGLAGEVLDTIAPQSLRQTTRARLRALDRELAPGLGVEVRALHERIAELPELAGISHRSDEPNGST